MAFSEEIAAAFVWDSMSHFAEESEASFDFTPGHAFGEEVEASFVWDTIITPASVSSDESTSTPTLINIVPIAPASIPSAASVSTPTLINILPISPASVLGGAVGTPTLINIIPITPAGVPSAESVGGTAVLLALSASSTASAESVGTPTLVTEAITPLNVIDIGDVGAAPQPVRNRLSRRLVEVKSPGVFSLERASGAG